MTTTTAHWAAPSAPSQELEARYQRAVLSGLSQAEFEPAERAAQAAADAAIDQRIVAARKQGAGDSGRWDSIYRAAVCAAAQAIQARDWAAKRQALAVAEQADFGRQAIMGAVFGAQRVIPSQYAAFEAAGRDISTDQSSAALRVIRADDEAQRQAAAAKRGAARASERAERAAAEERDAAALPTVGSIVTASVSYKLAKATYNDIATVGGEYAACPGARQGEFQARVVSHQRGRAYGKRTMMVLEVIE